MFRSRGTTTNTELKGSRMGTGGRMGGRYHPILFGLIALVSIITLGLSAALTNDVQNAPPSEFRSDIFFFLFTSIWTLLFAGAYVFFIHTGAMHMFASIGASALWLLLTALFWAVAAGILDQVRAGADCTGTPAVSGCRQTQALEAFGWIEFILCMVTLIAAFVLVQHGRRDYRGSYYV